MEQSGVVGLMSQAWSDSELSLCVDSYLGMVKEDSSGKRVKKSTVYTQISAKTGRTSKSVERKMQNVSAVVEGLGKQWLKGLSPLRNVGANVELKLAARLKAHPDFLVLPPLQPSIPYTLKLPAMREWLIRVAQARGTITYGAVMDVFEIGRFDLRRAMDYLGHEAKKNGEPILTALIVGKGGRCSGGIAAEFEVHDDERERGRLYSFWLDRSASLAVAPLQKSASVKERAARFASVEIRPEQAAFRRKVFERFSGICAISGCSVERALDAAHLNGRSWRSGHNEATDGVLLRKDLHALYDNNLLSISAAGVVSVSEAIGSDYAEYNGRQIREWQLVGGM